MEPLPFVSVVIDNYNYGRFLPRCIASALDQDYPRERFEVIVVDDGSTDGSAQAAAGFGDRIRFIRQQNQGQPGAFNTGLGAARGDIVCLLDADDFWEPEKLRETAAGFADPAVGIVQHPLRDADAEGRPLATLAPRWPPCYELQDYLSGRAALAAASGLAFRTLVARQVLPIPADIAFSSDTYLTVHALFLAKARNLDRMLGCHRLHGGNNWAGQYGGADKLEAGLRIRRTFRRHLDRKLEARGLACAPFFRLVEELEDERYEILIAMYRGRRAQAWDHWRGLWRRRAGTGLGAFRAATLALALLSPGLYLACYRFYGAQRWLVRLREALLGGRG